MLESLFEHTSDLPGTTCVTIEVEGENGYNLTGTLEGLRAYQRKPKNDAPKWEYKVAITFNYELDCEAKFNEWGARGWELVQFDEDVDHAIFKRRLGEKSS